jgi:hypothetical protein
VLSSWTGIAQYLGKDMRTVREWAMKRGMPVHREPDGRVWAKPEELNAWLVEKLNKDQITLEHPIFEIMQVSHRLQVIANELESLLKHLE